MIELPLRQECQEKVYRSCMFSVRTNKKEMMNVSRISRVVVWQLMCSNFGDLEMMSVQCVPS